jgi:hypothetical protein
MTDKPKIVIEVRGGVVFEVHAPDDVEYEIQDWDCGTECHNCGGYVHEDDACTVAEIPASDDFFPRRRTLCPDCFVKLGYSDVLVYGVDIDVDLRLEALREALYAFLKPDEAEQALDDVVQQIKSMEATDINNDGVDAQLKYLVDSGIKPDELKGMLADASVPF